jgi:alkanesulfonate monooxygenase SsuD/methylene tetrahydromethanopterin reductase-like flavin-dependent oxidoreductase (luciferase family)
MWLVSRAVRVGVSLRSGYVIDDVRAGARWMIERVRAARAADLDSLFVGDHHGVPVPYYQNTPIMGRLLAEWNDNPAGVLMLLPLWNPVVAAEQIGTLASVATGPFVLQCAVGGGQDQFDAVGADIRRRPSLFEAGLDIVRRLLAGEEVTAAAPYRVGPVRIAPVTPEPLEVWIGGHAPPAVDRAARLGDGWLAGPEAGYDEARVLIDRYREACGRHDREPTAVAIRRDVHVGADDADADRVAGPVLAAGYRGFGPGVCVVGGPERVTDELRRFAELGFTDVILRHLADDQGEVLASYERLAQVRAALAGA